MIEQHRCLQVEGSATSVWLQTWSLSTPHGIFAEPVIGRAFARPGGGYDSVEAKRSFCTAAKLTK
jgi:hypothetical protein